jgi:hypothetical protein
MDEQNLKKYTIITSYRYKHSLIKRQLKRRVLTNLGGDFDKFGYNYPIG